MAVLPTGIGPVTGGYQIERSLRFNSADSAYLNRTPASASNRRTWTYSFWVKRAKMSRQMFFGVYTSASDVAVIEIESDKIYWYDYLSAYRYELQTTQVLRDPSAWYHIMCVLDTTQATSSNRNKIYINGSLVTALTTATYPTQNLDGKFNTAVQHSIGTEGSNLRLFLDAYQTETYFIDGQALTPSSFGETDSNTGVWKPKAFSGTYGTNGFYLKFADNSGTTSTTLGKDSSGNGNNWTPNNFSVTAGAGNDSLVDSPTSYGTDTGVGGSVRGNYCTWNPLSTGRTLSNGNLDYAGSASGVAKGTLGVSSGKWYWEILAGGANSSAGVASVSLNPTTSYCGSTADSWCLFTSGDRYNNGSATSGYSTFTTNDIISIALDMDNGKVYWAKNGVWQGSSNPVTGTNAGYTNLSGYTITPANGNNNVNDLGTANFGQRAFAYTAPSGFKALCTQNLPTPTIGATSTTQANDYFNTIIWTGDNNSTGTTRTQTGVGFQPDFVWIKNRSNAYFHNLYDSVRGSGSTKNLSSNTTGAEGDSGYAGLYGYLSAFNSDGFQTTNGTDGANSGIWVNALNENFVAWNWKANGAGSTNTAGSITSTVSANTTSGFSIVTYTGTGSNGATVGHGLGVTPSMMIFKRRNSTGQWATYHTSVGNTGALRLNATSATITDVSFWNNTSPTSTVFTIGVDGDVNTNTGTYVAYCFAPVAGYSAFGIYSGTGSAPGAFTYLGFKPAFVLIKESNGVDGWGMYDDARDPNNVVSYLLQAQDSGAESSASANKIDFLSNGFRVCTDGTQGNFINESGKTYIYAAFAETPFKYSLGR